MTDLLPCATLPQQKNHKPCSRLAKHVCIPPCYCQPRNDTVYYCTHAKCFITIPTPKNSLKEICDQLYGLIHIVWIHMQEDLDQTLRPANPNLHHSFCFQVDYKLDINQILCNVDQVSMAHCLKNHIQDKFVQFIFCRIST